MDESNIRVVLVVVEVINASLRTMVQLASQGIFERNQRWMAPIISSTRHSKWKKIEEEE